METKGSQMKTILLNLLLTISFSVVAELPAQEKSRQTESDKAPRNTSAQTEHRIDVRFENGETKPLFFLRFLPDQYASDGDAMPLMIFLHGRGECGNDLELVKTWGPPRLVQEKSDFPFVVISPQCATPGWDTAALKGLLDHAIAELNVDVTRIYVTGLSMGGYGTWKFAARHPQLIAAAIPICGGGHAGTAESLKNVPIWAFHGDADRVVPLSASKNMVDAIKDIGGTNVRLTVYQDVGHNSWKRTYDNPDVYKWLLERRRKSQDR